MPKRSAAKHSVSKSRSKSKSKSRSKSSIRQERLSLQNKANKIEVVLSKSKSKSKSKSQDKVRVTLPKQEIQAIQSRLATRRNARAKINNTIKNRLSVIKPRVRAKYLDSICSDSGVCIAFGQAREKIGKHFNHFLDFSLVQSTPKKVGASSNNGFVYEIPFHREGYNAHAILKSSSKEDSDNLVYEYMTGKYINTLEMFFPCFLETYGLFAYTNGSAWGNAKDARKLENMNRNLIHVPKITAQTIRKSCMNPLQYCVLIQNLKGVFSLEDVVYKKTAKISHAELLYVLYQIYFCLHCLRDEFTHYDLHSGNVLLYEPVKGKKIRYTYEDKEGNRHTFDSAFIPKIIDYGRCHFPGNKGLYETVCQFQECDPDCGEELGYGWLEPVPPEFAVHHISSMYVNCSHDIRLYNIVKSYYKTPLTKSLKPCAYQTSYGTPPVTKDDQYDGFVANVSDCYRELEEKLKSRHPLSPVNDANLLAHIHVKQGHPMKVEYMH